MKKVKLVVLMVDKEMHIIDIVAETINLIDSENYSNSKVVSLNNIIDFNKVHIYGEDIDYVVFGEGDGFELNSETKKKVNSIIKKELESEEIEGCYSDFYEGDLHLDVMWVRTLHAIENGVEV